MAANYKVVDQRPVSDVGPTGAIVPAVEITFTTIPHNIAGRVRVPKTTYTPEVVDRILTKEAATIEDVQNL